MLSGNESNKRKVVQDEKSEAQPQRKKRFGGRRSRFITETGITAESQSSQITATPPDSQEGEALTRPPKLKIKLATRHKRPSFFPERNSPKVAEIKMFLRRKCDDVSAIKLEFDNAVDAMVTNCLENAKAHNRRSFIGKFLHLMAKQYMSGETMAQIIREENDGALVLETESSAQKYICHLFFNARAFGYQKADEYITKFRKKYPDSYGIYTVGDHDSQDIQFKAAALKDLLKNKKNLLAAVPLMKEVDDYLETELDRLVNRTTITTEPYFANLLKEHAADIILRFPNTAAHHIALFSVKIAAALCNAEGVSLPAQNPPLTVAPLMYAKVIAMPFMQLAAGLQFGNAVEWVNNNIKLVAEMTDASPEDNSSSSSSSLNPVRRT